MPSDAHPLAAGILLIAVSWIILLLGGRRRQRNTIEIDLDAKWELKHLVPLWTGKELSRQTSLENLARLWRAEGLTKEAGGYYPKLKLPQTVQFFEAHIDRAPYFERSPAQKGICARLLDLLDKEGYCASVVDTRGDCDAASRDKAYRALSRITLLDHTLNVATAMIQITTERKLRHVLADGLIAALAHDLGKLPSMRGQVYFTADHAITSASYLAERIEGFKKLSRHKQILQAVKLHHKTHKDMGLFAEILVLADRSARESELQGMGWEVDDDTPENAADGQKEGGLSYTSERRLNRVERFFVPPELNKEAAEGDQAKGAGEGAAESLAGEGEPAPGEDSSIREGKEPAAGKAPEEGRRGKESEAGLDSYLAHLPGLSGESDQLELEMLDQLSTGGSLTNGLETGQDPAPEKKGDGEFKRPDLATADLDDWYDEKILKREIRQDLNIVRNGCWTAFSMPDGYVYCQPPVLERAIRKMAGKVNFNPIIDIEEKTVTSQEKNERMRLYMLALVTHLRGGEGEEEIVARGLIKEGYFAGFFDVVIENAWSGLTRTTKGLYTPFHADWFGSVEELEKYKPERLKRVRSVKPSISKTGGEHA